jgi:hypothetical protein
LPKLKARGLFVTIDTLSAGAGHPPAPLPIGVQDRGNSAPNPAAQEKVRLPFAFTACAATRRKG